MFLKREIIDATSPLFFLNTSFYMSKQISDNLAENLLFSFIETLIFYENYRQIDINFFDEVDFAIKHKDCSYLDELSESQLF